MGQTPHPAWLRMAPCRLETYGTLSLPFPEIFKPKYVLEGAGRHCGVGGPEPDIPIQPVFSNLSILQRKEALGTGLHYCGWKGRQHLWRAVIWRSGWGYSPCLSRVGEIPVRVLPRAYPPACPLALGGWLSLGMVVLSSHIYMAYTVLRASHVQ